MLLDTHVLVWYTTGLEDLGAQAKALADRALVQDELAVSAITFWEIEMLIVEAASVDEVIAALRQAEIAIVCGPEARRDGTALFVHDPDGVRVELQLKR